MGGFSGSQPNRTQLPSPHAAHVDDHHTRRIADALVDTPVNNHPSPVTFAAKYPSQRNSHRPEATRAEVAKAAPSVHTLLET